MQLNKSITSKNHFNKFCSVNQVRPKQLNEKVFPECSLQSAHIGRQVPSISIAFCCEHGRGKFIKYIRGWGHRWSNADTEDKALVLFLTPDSEKKRQTKTEK